MNDVAAKLALPARWLMVIAIAYTLATTVLYFLSPPTTAPISAPRPDSSAESRPAPDLNDILASNLFGEADAVDAPAATEEPTVATRLPLELQGVFAEDRGEQSAAIISQRGRPGQLYHIGEEVPGSATLVEVHSDHVVLRRAGVRETLHFPQPGEGVAARGAANYGAELIEAYEEPEQAYDEQYDSYVDEPYEEEMLNDDPASVEELVDEYREELEEDPSAALQELGVSAVSDGAAEGYRIGDDLAQSPYLSQTGLQPGDVILSVNGRPVGDLNQDRLELDNVLAQGSARLEVQRGNRRFFVTASLR